MRPLQGREIVVAGAGAMGLTTALRLADAGASVTLCDPAPHGRNASGVAAGMLAPVFETLLDTEAGTHFPLLARARDLWPALMARIGLEDGLDPAGAVMVAPAADAAALDALEARMAALGVPPRRLAAAAVQALQPGLSPAIGEGLFTGEDWRLAPGRTLAALAAALTAAGGRILAEPVEALGEGFGVAGRPLAAEVVVCTGPADGLAAAAPELARLEPVKGQILRFDAPPLEGAVLRTPQGYVAPQPDGVLSGATMELGRRDTGLDPQVLARLRANAAALFPHLARAPAQGRAGVRVTTPDGLPLVGRSRGGAVLCTGARRNGWLLAPLAAEAVLACLIGGEASAAFDPRRFG